MCSPTRDGVRGRRTNGVPLILSDAKNGLRSRCEGNVKKRVKRKKPKLGKAATKRSCGPLRDGMYVHYSDVREALATIGAPKKERP